MQKKTKKKLFLWKPRSK